MSEYSLLTPEQRHTLKNIFSIILANAELIAENEREVDMLSRRLGRIKSACQRGEELLQQLGNIKPSPDTEELRPARQEASASSATKTVLVVDDEQDIVAIVSTYLTKGGYAVQGLSDSRAALEAIRRQPYAFDLLVTDMDMPHVSGESLCRQVHALRPDLPMILMTGYDRYVDKQQLVALGIDTVLTKPLERHVLMATVGRLLDA